MVNRSENSSSVGQLIPKCKEDILTILMKYKAFHEPCEADVILKFTNDLLEDFSKVFVEFIEGVISEKNPSQNDVNKNEDVVIIVDAEDEIFIKREDVPPIERETPQLKRSIKAEIDPKMLNESISNISIQPNGIVGGIEGGCEIIDLDAPPYGQTNSMLPNDVNSDIMVDKIVAPGKIISSKKRPLEQLDLIRPNSKKHKRPIHKTNHYLDCEICLKRSPSSSYLIYHRKNHLDEYSIHCQICLRFFSSDRERIAHQEKCDKRRYECYVCKWISADVCRLRAHFRTHSGEKPFKCIICPSRYTMKQNLHIHLKNVHKKIAKIRIPYAK